MKWVRDAKTYKVKLARGGARRLNNADEEWLFAKPLGHRHRIRARFGAGEASDAYEIPGDAAQGAGDFLCEMSSREDPAAAARIFPLPVRRASVFPGAPSGKIDGALAPEVKRIAVVIDDSFNLTSRRFCAMGPSGLKSRFARVWAQDAAACGQGIMPYGRLLDANEISKLANAVAAGAAEEEVLREAGLISGHGADYLPDPMRSRVSHGTHVADLFAGMAPDDPKAAETAIIAVQLPPLATYDTSGLTLTGVIHDAVDFVFDCAAAMATKGKRPPLVLNFSYGFAGGPRNGRSILERRLFERARAYRNASGAPKAAGAPEVDLVLPAGNTRLTQGHAIARADAGRARLEASFQVQPNDETSSFIEFWAPAGTGALTFELEVPGARPFTATCDLPAFEPGAGAKEGAPKKFAHNLRRDGQVVARLRHERRFPSAKAGAFPLDHMHRFLLAIAPTQTPSGAIAPAPAGLWTCRLSARLKDGALEAWILRDERVAPAPLLARQVYFEDEAASTARFDARGAVNGGEIPAGPQRRARTLSNLAATGLGAPTGPASPRIHVVGGRYAPSKDAPQGPDRVVEYSALAGDALPRVDAFADCEAGGFLPGLRGAGSRDGVSIRLNATSVAAPRYARNLLSP